MKPFNEIGAKEAKFSQLGQECLRGDVIVKAAVLPDDFSAMPKVKDHCLAHGEATGHAHRLTGNEESFELRECPRLKQNI